MLKVAVCLGLVLTVGVSFAEEKSGGTPAVLRHKMNSLDGKPVELAKYDGKVLLIVNTASRCGATPQYEHLQALHEKYGKQGLAVLGFPCNQFGQQEPGTALDIREFCTTNYGVTFDLFEKVDVNGPDQCDLYKYLTSKETNPEFAGPVKWNFEKFLISRDGEIVARYRTGISPESPELVEAIEAELKQ